MNGVYHTVKKNESLSYISRAYGVDMTRIADANNISSATIRIGERLFIPNAKLNASVLRNFYGETFIWPVRGQISSPFGYRTNPFSGQRTFHAAIDIVVNRGTAVKATRENSQANDVADRVECGQGSIAEVAGGGFSIRHAPLVLANILAPILIRLFDEGMANLVEPGGLLILAGILDEQAESVRIAGEAKGLVFIEQRQIGDWVALAMKRQ